MMGKYTAYEIADAYVAVSGDRDWKYDERYAQLVGFVNDNPEAYLSDPRVRGLVEARREREAQDPKRLIGYVAAGVAGVLLGRMWR